MLDFLGSQRQLCAGLTRRDWLQLGSLGMLGVGLDDFLRLQELQAATATHPKFGQAKACILLLPYGSPPQHETFDPKPNAPQEIRGEFAPIATSLAGVQISEGLPKIAKVVDRLTIIRSMTHPYPLHCTAYVTSAIPDYTPDLELRPRDPRHWPYIGSVVDYVEEQRAKQAAEVPRNIAVPWKMNSRGGEAASVQAGPYAAFLGQAYDPVLTDFPDEGIHEIIKQRPYGENHLVKDPYAGIDPGSRFHIGSTQLQKNVTVDRLRQRISLRDQLSQARRNLDQIATRTLDRHRQMAWSLLSSAKLEHALDIQSEPNSERENYGMTLFGQSCLLARRLVEAGSQFVTVFWDEYGYLNTDWDTHWNQNNRLKSRLLPGFDAAFSGLILDLEKRDMLDETLVVWMSEHGRTPSFNRQAGRDHWSRVYSIAMAGGGVAAGNVIGESDVMGGDVLDNPVSPKDILATVFHLLGIDAHTLVQDRLGQRLPIAGTGRVRSEIF